MQTLVGRHGDAVRAFITRGYGMEWPAGGFPVHLFTCRDMPTGQAPYSTDGNLLVVSGLDRGTRGLSGLEAVFHEAMHQWDEPIQKLLSDHARRAGKRVPPDLSHALIWATAGEAVRRVSPGLRAQRRDLWHLAARHAAVEGCNRRRVEAVS